MDRRATFSYEGATPRPSPELPVSYRLGEHLSAKLMATAPVASELAA
jgi:hypothetical protein